MSFKAGCVWVRWACLSTLIWDGASEAAGGSLRSTSRLLGHRVLQPSPDPAMMLTHQSCIYPGFTYTWPLKQDAILKEHNDVQNMLKNNGTFHQDRLWYSVPENFL